MRGIDMFRLNGLARKALARVRGTAAAPVSQQDLKAVNVRFVAAVRDRMPHAEAMEHAIGGGFEQIGAIEAGILRRYGLRRDHYLVDVGCGSGRLAQPLSGYLEGRYLGIDLVPDLVAHARAIAGRPEWRFEVIDHIGIPEADGEADMVCFFSVLTHLLHEQGFWYLEEAKRVLKPGGTIVFSFLEFAEPGHMPIFWATLAAAKARAVQPMNVFMERNVIQRFADALALELTAIHGAAELIAPAGNLGQAVAVLRKPVA
jgi:SAM-dependent methyltransferase